MRNLLINVGILIGIALVILGIFMLKYLCFGAVYITGAGVMLLMFMPKK